MYKVLKAKGHNQTITLVNTETTASVIIGQITMPILKILADTGYHFGEDKERKLNDMWDLEVTEETGKELAHEAMKMKKPDRTEIKSEQKIENKPKRNQPVDVFDLIYGEIR